MAKSQVTVDQVAVLDLKARVFEVEIPFDAAPRFVARNSTE